MGSSRIPQMYLTLAWPYMGCPWPWHHSTPYVSALLPIYSCFSEVPTLRGSLIHCNFLRYLYYTWYLAIAAKFSRLSSPMIGVLYCGFTRCYSPTFGYRVPTSHPLVLLRVYCPVQCVLFGPAPAVVAVALVLLGDRCCWIQTVFLGSTLVVIFSTCD